MTDPITRLNTALEDRYRIEREIGEGGMATVYLARDLKHNRNVALKVLKPELAAVVGAERFLVEIETTANLQHPHILPLFDSGQADSFLFYVMPYVEGDTLRDKIDREKQLSIQEALRITEKVASALDYAHRQGVVHRDIKPGNVLLSSDGEPTVADFGIALAVAQAGGGRVTETGLSVGTPHYMSPEQATGDRDVDPRTDVYALGCVLYEMLVGDPPYGGSTAQAVLAKILTDPAPAPTKVRLSIPPNVDAAIRKALEKLPADRFMSAQEFAKALDDPGFRHGEEAAAGAMAGAGPWRRLSMVLGGFAVLFAITTGWALFRPEPPLRVARQVLSADGWPLVEDGRISRLASLAPDGSSLILPAEGGLGVRMRESLDVTPIPGTDGGRDIVYSPDGRWIAYAVGTELFKTSVQGGVPQRLAEDVSDDIPALAWLEDGTILYDMVEGEEHKLVQIDEDGGEPRVVMQSDEAFNPYLAQGLPGGRGALVAACPSLGCNPASANLYAADLEGETWKILLQGVSAAWYSPTGHIVYVQGGALVAAAFDTDALEVTGNPTRLIEGLRVLGSPGPDMLLAQDGTLIYIEGGGEAVDGPERLVVVDFGGNGEPLPLNYEDISSVGWSPDGRSIAYASDGQIYTYDVGLNALPRQITSEGSNTRPVFSPDGSHVAFSSDRPGSDSRDVFVKYLDDDSPARSVISLGANQEVTQWPSDSVLIVNRRLAGLGGLWWIDRSDPDAPFAEEYLSTGGDLGAMSLSPDGTLAAYRSNESGIDEIYIRSFPVPGERTVVSRGGGAVPFWSPGGDTLYYARDDGASGFTFMTARLQAGPVPIVLSVDSLFTFRNSLLPFPGSGLHPDGDRFILAVTLGNIGTSAGDAPQPDRLIMVQNFFEELRELVGD